MQRAILPRLIQLHEKGDLFTCGPSQARTLLFKANGPLDHTEWLQRDTETEWGMS